MRFFKLYRSFNYKDNDGYKTDQEEYISKLKFLKVFSNVSRFRSRRAKLAWVTNSKPEIFCNVALLIQIIDDRFYRKSTFFKQINTLIDRLQIYPDLYLEILSHNKLLYEFIHI